MKLDAVSRMRAGRHRLQTSLDLGQQGAVRYRIRVSPEPKATTAPPGWSGGAETSG